MPRHIILGAVLILQKKDYDKAIADCSSAIKLKPDLADAYSNRGICLASKKELDMPWKT